MPGSVISIFLLLTHNFDKTLIDIKYRVCGGLGVFPAEAAIMAVPGDGSAGGVWLHLWINV